MKLWPLLGRHKVELLVPTTPAIGRGKLTVGKIYGGLLILENWKQTKFGTVDQPISTKVSSYIGLDYNEFKRFYIFFYLQFYTFLIFIVTTLPHS